MRDKDQETDVAYEEALAAVLRESRDEERHKEEEEEEAYQSRMTEAIALSTVGDYIEPPLAPSSPAEAEPGPIALKTERYTWDGAVHEWVNTSPAWLWATPTQE
ncbi:Pre-mRNA-processing factor 39 [Hordeum vulgare]|nr:Pre-mRNA-processing factor 39 [Hordeum vulgare]